MSSSRYIMIGGFLGAGKTTAINRFAQHLTDNGLSVGLITNDQGAGLVDTALGRSNNFPTEEISGGCFCCRFNSLIDAARNLTEANRPDVLLAEPVGSCTDLVATVSLPLQKIYGGDYKVAPLSVLVDPVRALRVLGLDDSGKKFSKNVTYIYRKQLEEAEVIVINKTDLVTPGQLATLTQSLKTEFPDATVFQISARSGDNCPTWFDHAATHELDVPRFLDIDYDRYGEGEALLGWLNTTVELEANADEFDGNQLLTDLAGQLRSSLESAGAEVAHLKMTLTPIGDPFDIAAVNLVRSDAQPELSHTLPDPLEDGELLLNIRAEASPETLETAVQDAFDSVFSPKYNLSHTITHSEHFRPGQPNPTHRYTSS
ncbi:MAG: GTP-binding protein [Verrucomicrobiales bacterium]|nr:GTP-binding protein [Verrucomicrobiales bacterium]